MILRVPPPWPGMLSEAVTFLPHIHARWWRRQGQVQAAVCGWCVLQRLRLLTCACASNNGTTAALQADAQGLMPGPGPDLALDEWDLVQQKVGDEPNKQWAMTTHRCHACVPCRLRHEGIVIAPSVSLLSGKSGAC